MRQEKPWREQNRLVQDDRTESVGFRQQPHLKETPAARVTLFGIRKNMADSTEGKAWSSSYLKIRKLFFLFQSFVIGLIRPGLIVKPRL